MFRDRSVRTNRVGLAFDVPIFFAPRPDPIGSGLALDDALGASSNGVRYPSSRCLCPTSAYLRRIYVRMMVAIDACTLRSSPASKSELWEDSC